MNKSISILIFVILSISILTPVFARNPAPINESVFFNTAVSTEASNWNCSDNGSLQQEWSVFPSDDYLMWNRSNADNQLQWWSGGDTIVFNGSKGSSSFSALMANNSASNRSQSLLWSYVNASNNPRSENVYVGPIWMNTSSGNATMVLYGNNSTFVLNRAYMSGSWALFNTEDFSYDPNGHAGWVLIPSDAIDYWDENVWGEMNLTEEGFYFKNIYNTYCGRIQSKVWGSNETDFTLMQEPVGWVVDQYFENATTDDAVFFGIAVWNPLVSSINVSFDYINSWTLNYSLNQSDTISWPTEVHPRPSMTFPIINMSAAGMEWWSLVIPAFIEDQNITNQSILQRMRNLFSTNMSSESRPFDVNLYAGFDSIYDQNDNTYYYTSVLTNFTDFYLDNIDEFPEFDLPENAFANNYLAIYTMVSTDGDQYDDALGYDYSFLAIDIDNNRQWDSNDRAVATTTWGEAYSWTGTEMDVDIVMSIIFGPAAYNDSNVIAFSWLEEANSPRNIHRYTENIHSLFLIPLWTCVKSNGQTLDNGDVFGLHIANYQDRPESICIWENRDEQNCSTFHNESNVDDIADLYWNGTASFLENFWDENEGAMGDCLTGGFEYCEYLYYKNYTMFMDCFNYVTEICLDLCETCRLNIDDDNIDMWGEGVIPGSPLINSTAGRFDINISIDINISYFNESEGVDNQTVNITFDVGNNGDMNLTGIQLNLTWYSCVCSDWKFWYIDSNISEPWNNITYHNDSCYAIFNLLNLTGFSTSNYWISFNISECTADTYGDILIEATVNSSSGLGASDNASVRIIWGVEGSYIQITGAESVVSPFEISETVLFFTGLCILIAAFLGLIAVVKSGWLR